MGNVPSERLYAVATVTCTGGWDIWIDCTGRCLHQSVLVICKPGLASAWTGASLSSHRVLLKPWDVKALAWMKLRGPGYNVQKAVGGAAAAAAATGGSDAQAADCSALEGQAAQ